MKILISTTSFGSIDKEPLTRLKKNGIKYDLNCYKRRLLENEIRDLLKRGPYDGLIAGTEPLTKDVLQDAGPLRVISRVGAGLDNVALDAARRFKIKVYNTPSVLTDSVAELTIGMILSSLRKIVSVDRNLKEKVWKKEMGALFKGKVLGIIGFGRIGKRVARLARAFGASIQYYDIKKIKGSIMRQVSINNLLRSSDIITIHTSQKGRLISKKEIAMMKQGVILINTSRGSAIDEGTLYKALKSKRVACAALDVYNNEPYSGSLRSLDNAILTPHIGSYSKEARLEMEMQAVDNLIKGFRGAGLL